MNRYQSTLALALLAVMCGCRDKPRPHYTLSATLAPIKPDGITGILPPSHGGYGINWTTIEALIPTGCVIAGNAEGVPRGYVLRKTSHLEETMGPPYYWCDPKRERKP